MRKPKETPMINFRTHSSLHEGPKARRRWLRASPSRVASPRRARRGGATLLEFALVMPMLLLVTMGMIQGGIILNARISLSNVIREVGRYAAVNGTKPDVDADIKSFAVQKAQDFNLTVKAKDVVIGPPAENTATDSSNRKQYVTQLPIKMSCDISGRVFLPTSFFGAKMLPGGVVTVDTNVMCE